MLMRKLFCVFLAKDIKLLRSYKCISLITVCEYSNSYVNVNTVDWEQINSIINTVSISKSVNTKIIFFIFKYLWSSLKYWVVHDYTQTKFYFLKFFWFFMNKCMRNWNELIIQKFKSSANLFYRYLTTESISLKT